VIDVPEFAVGVPMRCHHYVSSSPGSVCGALASWYRFGQGALDARYFCDLHHESGDLVVADSFVFRRVRVEANILIAAATRVPNLCQAEAVAVLERALERAGAVLDVVSTSSQIGRFTPRPSSQERRGLAHGG
jgi:hypothetical protein